MSDKKIGQNLGPIIPSKLESEKEITKKDLPQALESKVTLDSLNKDQAAIAGRSMVKPVPSSAIDDALKELGLNEKFIKSVTASATEVKKDPLAVQKAVAFGNALLGKGFETKDALAFEQAFKNEMSTEKPVFKAT